MLQLKNNIVVIENADQAKKYKQDIIKIWTTSFGDSDEYINMFLDNNLIGNCVLWIEDNIAVSMLFLLDCNLKTKDNSFCGKYVYAVATLPKYRNKGYTTKLLDFVNSTLVINQSYDFTVLVPSEKELFNFYKKRGYETSFFCEKGIYKNIDNFNYEYKILDTDFIEYKKFRNEFLKENYISCNEELLKYCFIENEFFDGKQIKIYKNQQVIAIAVLVKDKDTLLVREIVFDSDFINKEQVFGFLLKEFKCSELQYKGSFNKTSNKQPFGMIKWQKDKNEQFEDGYIGLVLD